MDAKGAQALVDRLAREGRYAVEPPADGEYGPDAAALSQGVPTESDSAAHGPAEQAA